MSRLEYEGRFLADVTDYGIFQARTSQAVAVDIWFETVSFFGPEGMAPYEGYRTRGRFFIIGRSGDPLPEQVTALSEAFDWDGDLTPIQARTWTPRRVQVVVRKDANDGRSYFNVAWVQRPDWEPPQAGNVDPSAGEAIASRYTTTLQSLIRKHRRQKEERPVPAAQKPAESASTTAAASAPSPPTPKPAASFIWNEKEAWKVFREKSDPMESESRLRVWEEAIHHFGDGRPKEELAAEQWSRVAEIDPRSWTPF